MPLIGVVMRRSARRLLVAAIAVLAPSALLGGPSAAQDPLDATVELDGREASSYDANAPLPLDADRPLEVRISATNAGAEPILLRSVRLRSQVMGLTFLAYETRVDLEVPPAGVGEVAFELDLLDLRSQATGLLPAEVELLDVDRERLVAVPLTVDVQGSFASVYGAFGLLVVLLTLLAGALALFRLATGRLPANRFARALQFAAPGLGLGLALTIGLSSLRIFVPEPALWGALLLVCGAVGFVAGYLSPAPSREEVVDLSDLQFELVHADTGGSPSETQMPATVESSPATPGGGVGPRRASSRPPASMPPESPTPGRGAPSDRSRTTALGPGPPGTEESDGGTVAGLGTPGSGPSDTSRDTVTGLGPPPAPSAGSDLEEPSRRTVTDLEPPPSNGR